MLETLVAKEPGAPCGPEVWSCGVVARVDVKNDERSATLYAVKVDILISSERSNLTVKAY